MNAHAPAPVAADTWDVLVVGAGPAGSTTAREVVRRGRRVLLVDRAHFPRAKVCGCCLNPRGLEVLKGTGLEDLPASLGAVPLRHIELHAGTASARLPLAGVALSRERFDAGLVEAAIAAGVEFRPSTTARLGPLESDARVIELSRGDRTEHATARVVVAADGLGSGLLNRAGLDSTTPSPDARIGASVILTASESAYAPGTIYMACGRAGYLGLVRLEDGRLDLACAIDADAASGGRGIAGVAAELLAEVGCPVPDGMAEAPWKGTPRLTRRPLLLGAERLFVVGDAAGYVEPFTGEGMSWALAGAVALAPLVVEACQHWDARLVARWQAEHRRCVRSRQRLCGWMAWALRRPWLMRMAARVLNVWPGLAHPLLHRLNATDRSTP